jgi:hypothetical protein
MNNAPHSEFIKDYVDLEEVCACDKLLVDDINSLCRLVPALGFQALLNMLTKRLKGLLATGMAVVSCAHHQLFRPLGLGDLQKGERQVMDIYFPHL